MKYENGEKILWQDEETGMQDVSKTNLKARVKKRRLAIPNDPFLSNRFVLKNIEVEDER